MQDSDKTEWDLQYDAFTQSRGYVVYENLQALESTFSIFKKNFSELIKWLEYVKDSIELVVVYKPDNMEKMACLVAETNRLLHNFLASAKTLIDHTRVIVKTLYSQHIFMKEYEIKLKQDLAENSLQLFVNRLRNYTQHYTLPDLAYATGFSPHYDLHMRLLIKPLTKWDGWGSSKAYLESIEYNLSVETLATEYFVLIESFYSWLNKRQKEIHKLDLESFVLMKKELYS